MWATDNTRGAYREAHEAIDQLGRLADVGCCTSVPPYSWLPKARSCYYLATQISGLGCSQPNGADDSSHRNSAYGYGRTVWTAGIALLIPSCRDRDPGGPPQWTSNSLRARRLFRTQSLVLR